MAKITINTTLSYEDYRRANYFLLYRKKVTLISLIVGVILLVGTMSVYLFVPDFYAQFPVLPMALGLLLVLLPPLSVWRSSAKNYRSDPRMQENFRYEFDEEKIQITGQSFDTVLSWSSIYKLEVTNNWLLIWQNPQMAMLLPKRDVRPEQIEGLKRMAGKNSGVRIKG